MVKFENSVMLREAREAEHKFNIFLNLLIFILVYTSISIASGAVLGVPMGFAIVRDLDYGALFSAIETGRIDVVISIAMAAIPQWIMIASLYLMGLNTLFSWLYCTKIEKRSARSMGFTRQNAFRDYGVGMAIGFVMLMAVAALEVALGYTEFMGFNPQVNIGLLLLYFFGYVIQGMSEEVLLRGYLMMSMSNRTKPVIALIVSSAVFGLMHALNPGATPMAIINITLIGLFFGLLVLRLDSIWAACGVHSAWNFTLGNIMGSAVSGTDSGGSVFLTRTVEGKFLSGDAFGLEGGICSTVIFVTAILLVIFLPQKSRPGAGQPFAI